MKHLVKPTNSQQEDIFSLVEKIKELGYAKVAGKYAKVSDETEAQLLLAIEEVLAKKEQQKIVEGPFIR